MTTLLDTLSARGMVHDVTPDLAERLRLGPITGYVGFDPTADSLHVGNLVPVMALAWLQRCGGRPLVLVGGGTGMVGDPSGKRTERRPMLTAEQVVGNAAAIQGQLSRFLDFGSGPTEALLRNNAEWLAPLGLLDFLRDAGKHFTIAYMLQKESVRSRLETGISFTEFSYMLVQAYDFAHLAREHGCELQMGGSDQWGNITAGIELASRRDSRKLHGLTLPLLTTAAGTKFGKSEQGNVWLDPVRTSPYAFHQFWLRVADADVEKLLRFFTFLELDEIGAIMAEQMAAPERRGAQRRLADDVTRRIHGTETLARVTATAAILFGSGELHNAEAQTLQLVRREVPAGVITADRLGGGIPIVDGLILAGLATSKGEARRGLSSGGFSVNGVVIEEQYVLRSSDLLEGGVIFLRKGKRSWAALEVSDTIVE